jgi:hypothetical protein
MEKIYMYNFGKHESENNERGRITTDPAPDINEYLP